VLGVSAIDVLVRTDELSPEQSASRQMGSADAVLSDSGVLSLDQVGLGGEQGRARPAGQRADLAAGLPPGSRLLPDASVQGRVSVPGLATSATLRELAYADPLATGLYRQVAGRPAAAGEVVLTTALAERLDVGIGGTVGLLEGSPPATVVGTVSDGSSREARTALVAPGTLDAAAQGQVRRSALVDVPGTLDVGVVRALNASGTYVDTRVRPVPGAPPEVSGGTDARAVAVAVLVAGMALLEVVLLAGPAFAVGARRSGHQLALLAATGAERRDVRRTVLAGGLVLGAVGAVAGTALGIGAGGLGTLVAARYMDTVPGPFEVRPLELAVIALVGVGTALLAAALPARVASRQDVVAALTGRRGVVAGSRRTPLLGVVAAVAGALLALRGAQSRDVLVILGGSALAELGLVATTPALVGLAGRLGPRLPTAPRLALRDAARNRGRTAPAVSAILAAVAGSIAVATYFASTDAYARDHYSASAVPGTAVLSVPGDPQALRGAAAALRETLPVQGVVEVQSLDPTGPSAAGYLQLRTPTEHRCAVEDLTSAATPAQVEDALSTDPDCAAERGYLRLSGNLVGGGDVLRAVTGAADPALVRVLDAGGVVVLSPTLLDGRGRVEVVVHPVDDLDGTKGRVLELPGAAARGAVGSTAIFSPAAAARTGLPASASALALTLTREPTGKEQDRAQTALDRVGVDSELYVERGYQSSAALGLLALLAGSAALVLGASGIATGLAAADGRADLATLAAVGATPGLRRRLAAAQSYVTAGLGAALGLVAGLVPAVGLLRALNAAQTGRNARYPVVVPWDVVLALAIVVPLLAAGAAALFSRSRLPLVRRLA